MKTVHYWWKPTRFHPIIEVRGIKYRLSNCDSLDWDTKHSMPDWMTLSLHSILEDIMFSFPRCLFNTPVAIPYHIIHGLICGYTWREIMAFIYICHMRNGILYPNA